VARADLAQRRSILDNGYEIRCRFDRLDAGVLKTAYRM